jgi:citrate synthase
VMEMLEKIGSVDRVHQYVQDELSAGRKIMGFGHRIYHTFDPRAVVLKGVAEKLTERNGDSKWMKIAQKLEDEVWEQRHIRANIEFYAAVVLNELGVPKDLMPAVFACNRVAGWIAHIYEQYADNRIIRPMTEYVGPPETHYVPIVDRS